MKEIPKFLPGDIVRTRHFTNAWWDEAVFLVVGYDSWSCEACLMTPTGFSWHPDWSLSHA